MVSVDLSCEVHRMQNSQIRTIQNSYNGYSMIFITDLSYPSISIHIHSYPLVSHYYLQKNVSQSISFIARKLLRYLVFCSKHWDNYLTHRVSGLNRLMRRADVGCETILFERWRPMMSYVLRRAVATIDLSRRQPRKDLVV